MKSNKWTKICQGCIILVEERGEHCRLHPKHQQRGGVVVTVLVIVVNNYRKVVRLALDYTIGINHP
jgi:hypothetical protein